MLDAAALDQIFRAARTHNAFSGEVTDAQLRAIWGDPSKIFPRNPRLDFDEACRIA